MQPTDPNQFTDQAWDAIVKSQDVARRFENQNLEVEHVMLAILESGSADKILSQSQIDKALLQQQLESFTDRQAKMGNLDQLYLGRGLDTWLDRGVEVCEAWQDPIISISHLVMAFATDERIGKILFRRFKIDSQTLEANIKILRASQKKKAKKSSSKSNDEEQDPLEKYGLDLTERAKNGKLDPVIGRDEEIRSVIQVLSRRSKNNPVLIGEPGVGKTAIAEGLAQRIINGDVPESLKKRQLITLDMGSLIAGAK